jgi:asparagine synthase (glutamine-hydrolysing)
MFARDRNLDLGKLHHMIDPAAFEAIHADADRFVPAWKKAVAAPSTRLSPEKLMHIESMSVSWRTMDPFERVRGREWFAPFTAQPVIELFARMPMYVLMHSAQDRAVARRAFAPYLPAGLLARRTKSYMDDFFLNVTRHNAAFLRETFLDGVLVKERILDRRKVEDTLSRAHVDSDSLVLKLIGPQLVMETWLRNWQRTVQPVARATAA